MCDNVSVVFPTHCISRAQAFTVHFVRRLKCNIKYTCRPKELKLQNTIFGRFHF